MRDGQDGGGGEEVLGVEVAEGGEGAVDPGVGEEAVGVAGAADAGFGEGEGGGGD